MKGEEPEKWRPYFDFVLKLEREGDLFRAHVVSSPAGTGSSHLALPASDGSLACSDFATAEPSRGFGIAKECAKGATEALSASEPGLALFDRTFSGRVRDLWQRSLGQAQQQGSGLRLRLRIDELRPETAWLANLPWESLRDRAAPAYLGLDPSTPIIRDVEGNRQTPGSFAPPLRVLGVAASPEDRPTLDLDAERRNLESISQNTERIQVSWLERATLEGLRARLGSGSFDVVHFVCHGGFHRPTERSVVYLERTGGSSDPVSGQDLGNLLLSCSGVRLVVLNACHTAEVPLPTRADPWKNLAATLVRHGLPAVIAMRREVEDAAAARFATSLLGSLAELEPLEVALAKGRKALAPKVTASSTWAIPALFLSSSIGNLFGPRQSQGEEGPKAAAEVRPLQPANTFIDASRARLSGQVQVAGTIVNHRRD